MPCHYDVFTLPPSPEEDNLKIWRFMDLTKFISLLDERALFFTNTKIFDDPYEGTLGRYNKNAEIRKEKNRLYLHIPQNDSKEEKELSDRLNDMTLNPKYTEYFLRILRNRFLVNSWHMNEHESAAMWDLLSSREYGIEIQSTIKRLCDSFQEADELRISKITYVDYENEWMDEYLYKPFLCKRRSFEHEKELRAFTIIYDNDLTDDERGL